MDRVLRVLIVDDSAYVRKVIKQMLSRSSSLEVVGIARDGEEALDLVSELHPDVVTVDLNMPGMGGLGFIREQMSRMPLPIIVVSIASENSPAVLDALDSGAVDFIQKPSALASEKIFAMADELTEKVRSSGSVRLRAASALPSNTGAIQFNNKRRSNLEIVVLGISTGGPQALKYLIPRFPRDFALPIVIVMHMPVGYTELYAKRLNDLSALEVTEAREGDRLQQGAVLLAPAGRHLTFVFVDSKVVAHLDARPLNELHRPSVNVLFRSAAETFGNRVLGVVMTGMGEDGKDGSSNIKSKGGIVLAEAEQSCVVFGMPRAIIEAGLADRVVPLEHMAEAIAEMAYGENSYR